MRVTFATLHEALKTRQLGTFPQLRRSPRLTARRVLRLSRYARPSSVRQLIAWCAA